MRAGRVTVSDLVRAVPIHDKLEAKGNFKVGAGAKVLAEVALNGKPAVATRFTLK
jgi:hypothetical protein